MTEEILALRLEVIKIAKANGGRKPFGISAPHSLMKSLDAIAEDNGLSRSSLIEVALLKAVKDWTVVKADEEGSVSL